MKRARRKGWLVTDRDKSLLKYIYLGKLATPSQIQRDFFFGLNQRVMQRRLRALMALGFVERKVFISDKRAQYYYAVTNAALSLVETLLGHSIQGSQKSESHSHDIALVDIRECLIKKNLVKSYYSENLLQTCKDFQSSESFKDFVRLNSDAALEIKTPKGNVLVALEYEASGQSVHRYMEKVRAYYRSEFVPVVLYVCDKQSTLDVLQGVDQEVSKETSQDSKLYFCLRSDVQFEVNEVRFLNFKGQTITIK